MSNAEPTPAPPEPKKQSRSSKTVWMILAPILFVLGIWQMYRGIHQMFGSGLDPQVKKLLTESDQAFTEANQVTETAGPDLQGLLNDVDKLGLDAVRKQKQDVAKTVSEQYGKAAGGFRQADAKIAGALKLENEDKVKAFLEAKSKAIKLYAQVCGQYQKMVALVMDPSIAKIDDLLPKLKQLADERDALQKQAQDAEAQAAQISGAAKAPAKS